jgi:hypothetical protein
MPQQHYLNQNYQTLEQLAKACDITSEELDNLVNQQLVPEPSYTVLSNNKCISQAFGELTTNGLTEGKYFHPSNRTWVILAINTKKRMGYAQAYIDLKAQFKQNFATELSVLNSQIFHLPDSFTDNGDIIEDGLNARTEAAWGYFLKGVFSLCVADPSTEKSIATKEILQEALITLTNNRQDTDLGENEKEHLLSLIEQYAAAAMPFSPLEYPNSSRKRLVEDLRATLISVN